jgi:hypothetical protein
METVKILDRMIKALRSLALVAIVCCTTGCATYFGYDGPYEGTVIDMETRQPLEGVVVHSRWSRVHPGPGGASGSYYDSREVLTDKEGKFKLKGVGLLILSNIEEPMVNVFKAGYTQKEGYWSTLKRNVEWDSDKATIKLRRMTLEERRKRIVGTPSTPSNKEIKLFMREENKENIEIGRPRNTLYPEELLK